MNPTPLVRFPKVVRPEVPPAGFVDLTYKNGALSTIDENGTETPVGSGGVNINPASSIVVSSIGTDIERGVNFVAAYESAKALTPNGSPLSATNRAQVVIPPGTYKLESTLTLDTNYVDLIALCPEKGGLRKAADIDAYEEIVPESNYRPPSTVIYADAISVTTIEQTVRDVRMKGFAICQLYAGAIPAAEAPWTGQTWRALYINIADSNANDLSQYDDMYFFSRWVTNSAGNFYRQPVGAQTNLKGTWRNCIANGFAWRCAAAGVFAATMYDCEFGANSIAGDVSGVSIDGAYMVRCQSVGVDGDGGASGSGSFGGCTDFAVPIGATSTFIDCTAGDKSFALSKNCAGTFIRCRAGEKCFGYVSLGQGAGTSFSGYAEDCVAGSGSFGGSEALSRGGMNGTLVRCTITGDASNRRDATGCTLRGTRIVRTLTDTNGVLIKDSNCVFQNCEIIVVQGGTGVPINASSAFNVSASGCRFNNASTDADGLGANVTNLVTTPYNVVSDAVK